jgi:hypothetical protein
MRKVVRPTSSKDQLRSEQKSQRDSLVIGDLVVGRNRACLGIIIGEALKEGYFWVYWTTGSLRDMKRMERKEMLYLYNGGEDGTDLLDWG